MNPFAIPNYQSGGLGMIMSDNQDIVIGAPNAENRAALACDRCKRRKIKCDRMQPACRACIKTQRSCSYPLESRKPGPKPGAPQRRRNRRVSGAESAHPYPSPDSARGLSNACGISSNNEEDATAPHNIHSPSGYALQNILQPIVSQLPSTTPVRPPSRGPALSQLLHLSHEPMPNSVPHADDSDQTVGQWRGIDSVCADLEITPDIYPCLLSAYFENMTAFSLFHRPTFDSKVSQISSPIQQRALLASMFSFSSRFIDNHHPLTASQSSIPSHHHFQKVAEESIDQALRECSDDSPPLCLLQALILTTFQQLIVGVRGRAWRAVHLCVSIAYDLHLHLVDKSKRKITGNDTDFYSDEEKRRAWWAIWEFDIFASTIRRLPTAIDWANNETWLPIDDGHWFANTMTKSCLLNSDPALAWKDLEKSGNQSAKAWFILTNALMRCAHLFAFPQAYSNNIHPESRFGVGMDSIHSSQSSLDVVANALYCLSSALPAPLSYNGEFLNFTAGAGSSLQQDSAKYCIHIMTQLSRFTINHLRVFNSTSRHLEIANSTPSSHSVDAQSSITLDAPERAAWHVYLSAASEIVTIVRNSSPKHVRYINPFLSNTIWLAAAAQVVSQYIGPHLMNRRVAESNFDLLQMNLDTYVSFWEISSALQQKLKTLDTKLEDFRAQARSAEAAPRPPTDHQLIEDTRTNHLQRPSNPQDEFPFGNTNTLQYPAIQQSGQELNGSQRLDLDGWTATQGLNAGEGLNPDLFMNIWGHGLDELLMYGGFE